jgi:regulator of replication initiation timing
MSGVLETFDKVMSENLAEIVRLSNNEKRLTAEVEELTQENQVLRTRVKNAFQISDAAAAKFMIVEKGFMNDFVSTAQVQGTNCEFAALSATCAELQRENNIYKSEIDKLQATLRLQSLRQKAAINHVCE